MTCDCEDCKVSAPDLRLKLQRKGLQLAAQSGKSSAPNMRDLHERLSGTMSPQLTNADQPKTKVVKSSSKSVGVEAPAVQIKRPADLTPKKSQKVSLLLLFKLLFDNVLLIFYISSLL